MKNNQETLRASLCFAVVSAVSVTVNAAPLELSALPIQTPPTLPAIAEAPLTLPSSARIEDLFVGDTRVYNTADYGYFALGIFDDTESAEQFARQSYYSSELHVRKPAYRCFSVAPLYPGVVVDPAMDWEPMTARHAQISLYEGSPVMNAVRVERIVDDQSSVVVEGREFWLDSKSGGMNEIGTNRLELNKVATPLEGLEVFVARTGEQQVDVVITRRPSKVEQELLDALEGQPERVLVSLGVVPTLTGIVGQGSVSSDCGHVRFRMRISHPQNAGESSDPSSFLAAKRETAVVTATALLGYSNESPPRLTKAEGSSSRIGVLRSRPLSVNVGLSKMSADEHPVLSVSYQWSGREATTFASDVVGSF